MCPFNRSNRYKDYVKGFPGPDFVSREWRCPLNRGVPKEGVPLYEKGVPFVNKRYTKGAPSLLKMVYKRVRGWTSPGVEPLRRKRFWVKCKGPWKGEKWEGSNILPVFSFPPTFEVWVRGIPTTATVTRTSKKAIGLVNKTTTVHVHHARDFFCPLLFPR